MSTHSKQIELQKKLASPPGGPAFFSEHLSIISLYGKGNDNVGVYVPPVVVKPGTISRPTKARELAAAIIGLFSKGSDSVGVYVPPIVVKPSRISRVIHANTSNKMAVAAISMLRPQSTVTSSIITPYHILANHQKVGNKETGGTQMSLGSFQTAAENVKIGDNEESIGDLVYQ